YAVPLVAAEVVVDDLLDLGAAFVGDRRADPQRRDPLGRGHRRHHRRRDPDPDTGASAWREPVPTAPPCKKTCPCTPTSSTSTAAPGATSTVFPWTRCTGSSTSRPTSVCCSSTTGTAGTVRCAAA